VDNNKNNRQCGWGQKPDHRRPVPALTGYSFVFCFFFPQWSYLWLNEGFARFMEHLAVDAIYPHWRIWESFVAEVFAQAQNLDALHSSHPVEVPVHHPNEVNEILSGGGKGFSDGRQAAGWRKVVTARLTQR